MFKRIQFQSIPAEDIGRAMEFYRDIVGLSVQTDTLTPEGGRWVFMELAESDTLLHLGHYALKPDPEGAVPMLALTADDVDKEAARMMKAGCTFVDRPQPAPWNANVRYATFRDSEGNLIMMQSSLDER